ncbi:MAG: GIY-YIG nuclease family protein [Candidatus Latescibacterota bacterium]|jgi:group I intron endonuclease
MDKSRQAELKREYKEAKRPAGVYQIKNEKNGRIFIGSSMNVNARINRHKQSFALLDRLSDNFEIPDLVADVKTYGPENFTFEVLETLDGDYDTDDALREDLKLLEQMWLEKCNPFGDNGYNVPN